MSLTRFQKPTLKDKHLAEERALKEEQVAVEVELSAVMKGKKRASKR